MSLDWGIEGVGAGAGRRRGEKGSASFLSLLSHLRMLTVLARPLLRSIIPTTRHLATMSTQPELIAAIAAQGNIIRTLKAAKGDPAEVTAEVAKLSALKTELSALTGAPDGGKGKEKKATKYVLKTPKVRP